MITDDEQKFLQQMRTSLNASESSLDDSIVARLKNARIQALSEPQKMDRWTWIPVASVASVATMLVLVSFLYRGAPQHEAQTVANGVELELLMSQESLELLEQLEFYQWLDNENTES